MTMENTAAKGTSDSKIQKEKHDFSDLSAMKCFLSIKCELQNILVVIYLICANELKNLFSGTKFNDHFEANCRYSLKEYVPPKEILTS